MKPQKGLGRGLDALFSNDKIESAKAAATTAAATTTTDIQIGNISPNTTQPRREFGEEELRELSDSIKELGMIQPITVRRSGADHYTIISGERRWRAARMAGLTTIPTYVRDVDDEQMHSMALVENILREDLNPLEIALALQRLLDECGLTQEALSKRLSMKRSSVSNYLRLLRLGDEIQFALKGGLISMGHAKAIASVESNELQLELLKLCVDEALSVRQAESYAQRYNTNEVEQKREAKPKAATPSVAGFERLSQHLLGIFPKGVSFKESSRGGGKITISYSNPNELKQLIKELGIEK